MAKIYPFVRRNISRLLLVQGHFACDGVLVGCMSFAFRGLVEGVGDIEGRRVKVYESHPQSQKVGITFQVVVGDRSSPAVCLSAFLLHRGTVSEQRQCHVGEANSQLEIELVNFLVNSSFRDITANCYTAL